MNSDNEITLNEKMPCFRIQFDATGNIREELTAALEKLSFSPDSALLLHIPADSEIAEIVVDETELSREPEGQDWLILGRGEGALENFLWEVEKLT